MYFNCKNFLALVLVSFLVLPAFARVIQGDAVHEIGLSVSSYKYREPELNTYQGPDDIALKGINVGLDYIGTFMLDSNWFARLDIITAFGQVDYTSQSCGTKDNEFNWYVDFRGLYGRNFYFDDATFSPYVGMGSRYLYNDGIGDTTTKHKGYRRESNYLYVPIGFVHEFELNYRSQLSFAAEFDLLVLGKQVSYLSDVNSYNSDIHNWQNSGYGARCSVTYRINGFSIGPYLNYWNIDNSESVSARDPSGKIWNFIEPKNYTIEAGARISYRF